MTQAQKNEKNKVRDKFRSNSIIKQFRCAIKKCDGDNHVKCESHDERMKRLMGEFIASDTQINRFMQSKR